MESDGRSVHAGALQQTGGAPEGIPLPGRAPLTVVLYHTCQEMRGRRSGASGGQGCTPGSAQSHLTWPLGGSILAWLCGCSSVGRASASQAECRGFESHHPLHSMSPALLPLPVVVSAHNVSNSIRLSGCWTHNEKPAPRCLHPSAGSAMLRVLKCLYHLGLAPVPLTTARSLCLTHASYHRKPAASTVGRVRPTPAVACPRAPPSASPPNSPLRSLSPGRRLPISPAVRAVGSP